MEEESSGVKVTTREIYDKLNEVASSVGSIGHRIENIERSLSEIYDKAKNAEEISRSAKEDAEEAIRVANSAYKKANETNKTVREAEEEKKNLRNKILFAVISGIIPYLAAGVIALIYLGRSVLGG